MMRSTTGPRPSLERAPCASVACARLQSRLRIGEAIGDPRYSLHSSSGSLAMLAAIRRASSSSERRKKNPKRRNRLGSGGPPI